MRKIIGYALLGFVALVATLVIGGFLSSARAAEVFTWSLPASYSDNTPITASTRATITTKIYWASTSAGCATGALYTTVLNGVTTYTGNLPTGASSKGTTSYWCATASIPSEGGVESIKGQVTAYTVPFVAPGPPSPITINP